MLKKLITKNVVAELIKLLDIIVVLFVCSYQIQN
jgi:hypothetical protein